MFEPFYRVSWRPTFRDNKYAVVATFNDGTFRIDEDGWHRVGGPPVTKLPRFPDWIVKVNEGSRI